LLGAKLFTIGISEEKLAVGLFLRICAKEMCEIGFGPKIGNEYENSLSGKLTDAKKNRYAGCENLK
jgi:hypothetical protein